MRIKRLLRTIVIVALLGLISFYVRIDYYLVVPSRAVDLSRLIEVENAAEVKRGTFYLVTVTQQRANLLMAAYGLIHPYMELRSIETVLPRDMDEVEYRELLAEYMVESQHMAQVVALRRVGYEVGIISEGVEIVDFLDDAPAEGYLDVGDKITSVNGNFVFLASEIPLLVQKYYPGEEVPLAIVRDSKELNLLVPTGSHPDDSEMAFLGIYIRTLPWKPEIPIDISMNTGNIGGPSAGLMFVLEIMNQLLPEDIAAGKKIAGTGTIDFNETVGRVGGVTQKVVAAERAGAEYFLVPQSNYDEAVKGAGNIEIIAVESLDDVLAFLGTLNNN